MAGEGNASALQPATAATAPPVLAHLLVHEIVKGHDLIPHLQPSMVREEELGVLQIKRKKEKNIAWGDEVGTEEL